jgi:hypothetical protein
MLAQQLLDHLSVLIARQAACNPLLLSGERGKLSRDQIACYLYNTAYFALNTQIQVELGLYKARATNQPELVHFFLEKKAEESGHDQWAIRDLERLQCSGEKVRRFAVHESLRNLFSYVQAQLDRDPSFYLIYSLFAEYINAQLAPGFVRMLVERCAVSEDQLSMLVNHAKLDPDHVAEDCRVIDALDAKGCAPSLKESREFLDQLDRQFCDYCRGISEDTLGDARESC